MKVEEALAEIQTLDGQLVEIEGYLIAPHSPLGGWHIAEGKICPDPRRSILIGPHDAGLLLDRAARGEGLDLVLEMACSIGQLCDRYMHMDPIHIAGILSGLKGSNFPAKLTDCTAITLKYENEKIYHYFKKGGVLPTEIDLGDKQALPLREVLLNRDKCFGETLRIAGAVVANVRRDCPPECYLVPDLSSTRNIAPSQEAILVEPAVARFLRKYIVPACSGGADYELEAHIVGTFVDEKPFLGGLRNVVSVAVKYHLHVLHWEV